MAEAQSNPSDTCIFNSPCSAHQINKIYILAQYQSSSLNRYLTSTYNFQSGGIPMGGDGAHAIQPWGSVSLLDILDCSRQLSCSDSVQCLNWLMTPL